MALPDVILFSTALNVTPMDIEGNLQRTVELLKKIEADYSSQSQSKNSLGIVLLPEKTLVGHCEDFSSSLWLREKAITGLQSLLPFSHKLLVLIGLPQTDGKNELWLLHNGEMAPISTDSQGIFVLAGYNAFYWKTGDNIPETAQLIFAPDARPFIMGGEKNFRQTLSCISTGERVVVASDYLGNEGGAQIYTGSALIARNGTLISHSEIFSYQESLFTSAAVCWTESGSVQNVRFSIDTEETPFEEFPRATALALFDYMRKSRSCGFTLSLSGGADSAAIAVIISLMVRFGCHSIGQEGFLKKLAYIPEIKKCLDTSSRSLTQEEIVHKILTTAYQGTKNSSDITRNAAKQIANAVGALHYEFQIEPIVQMYKEIVSQAIGRPLSWNRDDLALQNIQARTRSPGIWLLSNLNGSLLLSTGNRSEASVGYMTMDGDTSGCLSPIAGISKAFLRKWLVWMEHIGIDENWNSGKSPIRFALPALKAINDQQPTAELRPLEAGQTDEGDLMPYSILDIIEHGVVQKRLMGESLLQYVRAEARQLEGCEQTTEEQIVGWVEKFCKMFPRASWKRRRTAPSFILDTYSLAPGNGNDLPLLVGHFG